MEPPAPPEPASSGAALAHAPLEAPHVGDDEAGLCPSILAPTAAPLPSSGADSDGGEALELEGRVDQIRGLLEAHQFVQAEAVCEASLADHPGHPEFLGLRSALSLEATGGPVRLGPPGSGRARDGFKPVACVAGRSAGCARGGLMRRFTTPCGPYTPGRTGARYDPRAWLVCSTRSCCGPHSAIKQPPGRPS
jgi:hypothetical protein